MGVEDSSDDSEEQEGEEGEEWKAQEAEYSIKAYYALQRIYLGQAYRSLDQVGEALRIAMLFKPLNKSTHAWGQQCLDRMVQSYIDNDNVFRRAFNKPTIDAHVQYVHGLRGAIDYAMREGHWHKEAVEWIELLEEEPQDGADRP